MDQLVSSKNIVRAESLENIVLYKDGRAISMPLESDAFNSQNLLQIFHPLSGEVHLNPTGVIIIGDGVILSYNNHNLEFGFCTLKSINSISTNVIELVDTLGAHHYYDMTGDCCHEQF